MAVTCESTIGEIVADDYRTASVFQRHGLDFCCGGGRTVEEACREAGVDPTALLAEIERTVAGPPTGVPRFGSWDVPTLVTYIIGNHHAYVRGAIPVLLAHTQKIAGVHGDRHPELRDVAELFQAVADEMTSHMFKEERMLFPHIVALADAVREGRPAPTPVFCTVENPIRMMEMEHESAGGAMAQIRELTGNYQPPEDACTTYRVTLQELEAFENDLHDHVHLENNILFPKSLRLEAQAD
jgi:regulator of cell morphogenesis and NO signaling